MTTILLGLALVAFSWVLYRFVLAFAAAVGAPSDEVETADESELAELVSRKRLALFNLKEMELDFATGKIGQADYDRVRGDAETEAIELMQAIDEVRSRFKYTDRVDEALAEIEKGGGIASLIARDNARAAEAGLVFDDAAGEDESPAVRARALLRERTRTVPCARCGASVRPTDKFCAECGAENPAGDGGSESASAALEAGPEAAR